jgi:hypothetical protein
MNKDHALGGLLIGLLGGAVLGAFIFSVSGSLDLGFGMLLILIVALVSAATGWFAGPSIMTWWEKQRKPLSERKEYQNIVDHQQSEHVDTHGSVEETSKFSVDLFRLGGLALLFFGLAMYFLFLIWYQNTTIWIFFSLFFVGLTIFNLVKIVRNTDKSVEIRTKGFEYKSKSGARFIEWKEVDYIWEKYERIQYSLFPIKYEHVVKMELRDGTFIFLDRNLKGIGKLANLLHEGITRIQLPIAMNGLQRGATIDFRILHLNADGITHNNRSIGWQDVEKVIVKRSGVAIQKTGKNWTSWAMIKGSELPNLRLFALLANEYTKVE